MPPNPELDEFLSRALSRDTAARFASATEMLEAWWRVVAALDRDAPLPEIDVVFDEDEWTSTIASSMSRSGAGPSSVSGQVRMVDMDAATDPQMTRPSEGTLAAAGIAFDVEPPSESGT
jgi:hypothetical protein